MEVFFVRHPEAKKMLELAESDQNRGGTRESGQNRVTQEVGEHAEPAKSECQLDDSNQHRQDDPNLNPNRDIAFGRYLLDGIGHQERVHRNWGNRQVATASKNGINQQREHARVESDRRRQASERGIGHALRDEKDCDDEPGNKI
jgi:hypothetical protein